MGRNYSGKRRNCSLRAISPFPTVFSKDLYRRHVKKQGLFGKGLNPFSNSEINYGMFGMGLSFICAVHRQRESVTKETVTVSRLKAS